MANMQSAVFYPFTWLFVIFDFSKALILTLWLHSTLAGFFMYLLTKELGCTQKASFLSGFLFAFNGFLISHYAFPIHFQSIVWLPLILYFFQLASRTNRWVYAGAGGLAFSLQIYAGHPQFAFYSILVLLIYWGLNRSDWKSLKYLVCVVVLALVFTAVQWVPAYHLALSSPRLMEDSYLWATDYSLKPLEFILMLIGPLWNRYIEPSGGDPNILAFYIGIPALFLSLVSLVSIKKETKRFSLTFGVITLLGIFLSFGKYLPFYPFLYKVFIPLQLFRFPAQAMIISCFGLSVLVGLGYDRLKLRGKTSLVLIFLCGLDLFLFSIHQISTINPIFFKSYTKTIKVLRSDKMFMRTMLTTKSREQSSRVGENTLDATLKFTDSLYPNINMAHGIYDAHGYEQLRTKRYDEVLFEIARDPLSPWMNVLNVGYLLSFWSEMPKKFRLVDHSTVYIFKNTEVLPRAYWVPKAIEVKDTEIINYVAKNPEHNFREEVLLPGPVSHSTFKNQTVHKSISSHVEIVNYNPNIVEIKVDSTQPGWLVLSDAYDKGWSVTVNGKEKEITRANYIQRAVYVEEGSSVVIFRYRPLYFWVLALISFGGIFLFILSLLYVRCSS